jgi:hypothetical protein
MEIPLMHMEDALFLKMGLIIGLEKIVPDSFQTESVVINPQTYITGNGSAFL